MGKADSALSYFALGVVQKSDEKATIGADSIDWYRVAFSRFWKLLDQFREKDRHTRAGGNIVKRLVQHRVGSDRTLPSRQLDLAQCGQRSEQSGFGPNLGDRRNDHAMDQAEAETRAAQKELPGEPIQLWGAQAVLAYLGHPSLGKVDRRVDIREVGSDNDRWK